jgi:DNA-binding transcriptional regulator YdaS (Cro superfamily)
MEAKQQKGEQPQHGTVATQDEIIEILRAKCETVGGQREWARQNGFSVAFVNDVLHHRRNVTATLARSLGFERVTDFRRQGS